MTYTLSAYNAMIADRTRTEAYTRAMTAVIREGSVVADVGTGTGYFAVLACQLGASKVYAIEPGEIIDTARNVARANGCADRIEFLQARSTDLSIGERVDVVVSDLRGSLPFHGDMVRSMIDLRERYLKPGGVLIPAADDVYAVLVNSEKLAITSTEASLDNGPDMGTLRSTLRNTRVSSKIRPEECVSDIRHLGTLDYYTVGDGKFTARARWEAGEAVTANGMCVWFDADIHAGIGFSNSPASPQSVYGRSVFPFLEPVVLSQGDTATIEFKAMPNGGDYLFRWDTDVFRNGHTTPGISLRQSTFTPTLASLDRLKRRRNDFVPARENVHRHTAFVLEQVDGTSTLESIARSLSSTFPDDFPDWGPALSFVCDTLERHS